MQCFLRVLEDSKRNNIIVPYNAFEYAKLYDNFAYDEAMRQERFIVSKINDMINDIPFLKVVDDEFDNDKVNINDAIEVLIKYAENDEEIEILKLTGNYSLGNDYTSVREISLNSPIGKAIYKQDIGTNIFYYVGNNKIEVSILRRIKD